MATYGPPERIATDVQRDMLATLTKLIRKQPPDFVGAGVQFRLEPATAPQLQSFRRTALSLKVPGVVVEQLAEFYEVANGFWYESVIGFHSCDDESLFEWWSDGHLWLGVKDLYVLRWNNGKYSLGDASTTSFSENHEATSMRGLLDICLREIEHLDADDRELVL